MSLRMNRMFLMMAIAGISLPPGVLDTTRSHQPNTGRKDLVGPLPCDATTPEEQPSGQQQLLAVCERAAHHTVTAQHVALLRCG